MTFLLPTFAVTLPDLPGSSVILESFALLPPRRRVMVPLVASSPRIVIGSITVPFSAASSSILLLLALAPPPPDIRTPALFSLLLAPLASESSTWPISIVAPRGNAVISAGSTLAEAPGASASAAAASRPVVGRKRRERLGIRKKRSGSGNTDR